MKFFQIGAALWLSTASASDISLADAMDGKDADRMYGGFIKIQVTNPSPLHPMGNSTPEQQASHSTKHVPNIVNFAAKLTSKEQMSVCERTKKVLFVKGEAPAEASLGGPVYEECMSAMEPLLREHNSKTKSTDVLNGCTGLINDLTANQKAGADTQNLCSLLMDQLHPTVPPKPKMVLKPPSHVAADSEEHDALTTVCALTIKSALKNVKNEADAMQLGTTVAPLCQNYAKQELLGGAKTVPAKVQEWCYELDGRLTLAIETGYLFALHPTQAVQQATEPNPYAQETRQRFCDRFVKAVQTEKSAAKPLQKIAKPTPAAVPQATPASTPKVISQKVATPPAPVAAPKPSSPKAMQSMKLKSSNAPGASVDMLGLMQQLSQQPQWNGLCTSLLGSLTSEEGAVTEEYALGDAETKAASLVLTFNAEDQAQVGKCATNLKVLAIRSKVLGVQSAAEGHHRVSALSIAERAETELQNTEAMAALIDSPWARDACADIAHGFLVAHLAHPDLKKESFCPMYAKDLKRMRSVVAVASEVPTKPAQSPPPAKVDAAAVAAEAAKRKAAEKAQALKQLRSRQAAELAAKAKAAAEKKKLEQQQQQRKAELADAQQSGSMFLRDMAAASANNADAAEFELKHPDGDDLWSQFSQPAPTKQVIAQPVYAKPATAKPASAIPVNAMATKPPVKKLAAKVAPAAKAVLLPVAVSAPAAATPADVDSGFADMFGGGDAAAPTDDAPAPPVSKAEDDVAGAAAAGADGGDDGAEFWKQMFQR